MNEDYEQNKVVFDEEQLKQRPDIKIHKTSKIADWVIKHSGGIIKNEVQANYFLIVFVLLMIIISFSLVDDDEKPSVPSGELYYGGPNNR